MKLALKNPPRTYKAGFEHAVTISDCGSVELQPDEQLTFITPQGGEYDLTRKSWGFYATPSLNGRLKQFGLRPVLVKNRENRFFILLVERGNEDSFNTYVALEKLDLIAWLDDDATLERIQKQVKTT
jgi:hypothetical protein